MTGPWFNREEFDFDSGRPRNFGPDLGPRFGPDFGTRFGPGCGSSNGPGCSPSYGPNYGWRFGPEDRFGPDFRRGYGLDFESRFGPLGGPNFGPEGRHCHGPDSYNSHCHHHRGCSHRRPWPQDGCQWRQGPQQESNGWFRFFGRRGFRPDEKTYGTQEKNTCKFNDPNIDWWLSQ